jgi:hypothetical protein
VEQQRAQDIANEWKMLNQIQPKSSEDYKNKSIISIRQAQLISIESKKISQRIWGECRLLFLQT